MYTPCGAPVVSNVAQVTVPSGVSGLGLNVIGVSVVPHGWVGSPQSGNALVDTTPVKEAFFVTLMVIVLLRFWLVLIVAVLGTA